LHLRETTLHLEKMECGVTCIYEENKFQQTRMLKQSKTNKMFLLEEFYMILSRNPLTFNDNPS